MLNLPVFVVLDCHQKVIQVCVMDQNRKILVNESVDNDPAAVLRVVAPFGSTVRQHRSAAPFTPRDRSQYRCCGIRRATHQQNELVRRARFRHGRRVAGRIAPFQCPFDES